MGSILKDSWLLFDLKQMRYLKLQDKNIHVIYCNQNKFIERAKTHEVQ